jgi:hypothetical protein
MSNPCDGGGGALCVWPAQLLSLPNLTLRGSVLQSQAAMFNTNPLSMLRLVIVLPPRSVPGLSGLGYGST